jgi:1-deoxy-D-xylulose-5-phosphate synthase
LPDRFVDQGDPALQLSACGLDKAGLLKSIRDRIGGEASARIELQAVRHN